MELFKHIPTSARGKSHHEGLKSPRDGVKSYQVEESRRNPNTAAFGHTTIVHLEVFDWIRT